MKYLLAFLPGIILIIILSCFFKPVSKKNIIFWILLLIIGAFGSYICYRFEMHFGSFFKKVKASSYWEILFYAVFGVAIFEEGYKWFVTFISSFLKKKESILVISILLSIGFATFESLIYYCLPYGSSVCFSRIFSAFPSHICNALWMGFFLIIFQKKEGFFKWFYLIISLVFPIIVHALYNSFLYGNHPSYIVFHPYYWGLYFGCSVILLIIIIKKKIC